MLHEQHNQVRGYCRGDSPAGLYTFRRQRPGSYLVDGSARDYLRFKNREGFPEFTRFAMACLQARPLFSQKETAALSG